MGENTVFKFGLFGGKIDLNLTLIWHISTESVFGNGLEANQQRKKANPSKSFTNVKRGTAPF